MKTVTGKDFFEKGLLVLADATGEDVSVCLAKNGSVLAEKCAHGGALENFFILLKGLLAESALTAEQVKALGFCRGPGSILGIRIVSAAFASIRAQNPDIRIFVWDLLPAYAKIMKDEGMEDFSIICPSRKGFANVMRLQGGASETGEIPSAQICGLPLPRFLISQRKTADNNFDGLEEVHFPSSKIYQLLKADPGLALVLEGNETADALTLAKREYAKWNSQAHS